MKLFIFGSTGDLVKRKVIPALNYVNGKDLEVYALGRRELRHEDYQDYVCEGICKKDFKQKIRYLLLNYNLDNFCDSCLNFLDKKEINYFYIAFPPKLYKKTLISLGKIKKSGFKIKILIEKPFGKNLENAKELIKIIREFNLKKDLFLSDHYLFKENVLNLKKQNFNSTKIISTEKIGLEGRDKFYEDVGVLKDMVQSHLLNILFKFIKNKKRLKKAEIEKFILARCEESDKNSKTPTFVYLKFKIKKESIILVSGKFMDKKETTVYIDDKKIEMGELNPYIILFENFFEGEKKNFPTIKNAIFAWEIIEDLEKKKPEIIYYKKGSKVENILK